VKDYYFQKEAIHSIYDYFSSGKTGNPLIALPTGTGKSHVQSGFIHGVLQQWPSQRFLCMAHVKELVEQNASKLLQAWPSAPVGIYSAGLKRKDYMDAVIFGGIASVKNKVERFGHRDIIFIDEAHLVSPEGETAYRKVIDTLKGINPHLKVIGLTATPYRLGHGKLFNEGTILDDESNLFTDLIYNKTDREGFARLIAEGYLCPLIPKKTSTELDLSSVGIANGDFKAGELQAAVDRNDVTFKALQELCTSGTDRRSWLIFATGVKHSEHIAEMLQSFGIPTAAVHSKLGNQERTMRIKDFKAGKLRCLVNNNVLTTGFDHPPVDLIGMLRPTISPGLWVQMAGRGTRMSPGKENCLLLDYAGNTARLGPIDDPCIPKKRGKGGGDAPVKVCNECGTYNHISARECILCEHPFPVLEKIKSTASVTAVMATETPVVTPHTVSSVVYHAHTPKNGSTLSMRVTYYCDGGLNSFREWIHFESERLPLHKAREWWRERFVPENGQPVLVPATVVNALEQTAQLRVPKVVRVWENKKYPEIISHDF